jgi:lysophospholipase L1-like esterase
MEQVGCNKNALGPGAAPYPGKTQIAAATKFIKANRSKIALITVSIGGNDVTACARAAEAIPCVAAATEAVNKNVTAAAKALRAAAGPKPKIVGTTYPDVVLGAWVNPGGESSKSLAGLSVIAFQSLINPALKKAYASGKGSFVDVTAATGAYGDLTVFETLAPYGSIPKPVADVCRISYYCDKGDIHLRTPGYKIIAKMVAAELPRVR